MSKKLNSSVEDVYEKFITMIDQNKDQQKTIENLQQQLTEITKRNSNKETQDFI